MKTHKPKTAIQYFLNEKEIRKIYKYFMSGKWKNKKVEIEVSNWEIHYGKFVCRIEKFIPFLKQNK